MSMQLSEEDYDEIKRLRKEGMPNAVIARKFSRSESAISDICNGKTHPRTAKTERSSRHLTPEEYERIKVLKAMGMKQKDIALKIHRSCYTVCVALKKFAEQEGRPNPTRRYNDIPLVEYVDLSSLPDTVLFKHTREFCF